MEECLTGTELFIAAAVGDVVKSTALLPVHKEAVNRLIAEFLGPLRGRDGILHAKHSGDGFVLYGTDPKVIVTEALKVRDLFRTTEWQDVGLAEPPKLRIGLDGGFGTVGLADAGGYEATGSGIEGAARLEPVVRPGDVWASEILYDSIRTCSSIGATPLGEIALAKGAGTRRVVALAWAHEPRPTVPKAASAGSGTTGVSRYEIPLRLVSNNGLSLVLVQTAPLSAEQLQEGGERPSAMAALRQLFDRCEAPDAAFDPALDALAQAAPHLVVFPEFAFDPSHWQELDERIRRRSDPIIVIAGFGPAKGRTITEWGTAPGTGTERVLPNEKLQSAKSYNGGWCWVHDPAVSGRTWCFCYLKNFREQSIEPQIVTEEGRTVLALRFEDLLLLPAICADLVCTRNDGPQERFRQIAAGEQGRPNVLVVGSLYDSRPWHSIWNARLNYLVQSIPDSIVALVNCAFDVPRPGDDEDGWRTRSGIYKTRISGAQVAPVTAKRPFIRARTTDALAGGVARCANPSILFGRIAWGDYGPTLGRWLWEVSDWLDLETLTTAPPSLLDYEFSRFLRRHIQPGTDQQKAAVQELALGGGLRAQLLAGTCLHGLGAKVEPLAEPWDFDAHPTDPHEHLQRAAEALCQLAGSDQTAWCHDPATEGPLRCASTGANILVWSGEKGRSMHKTLRAWTGRTDPHPPLVAVAHAYDGRLNFGPIKADRHDDFSSPPAEAGDIGEARGTRFATVIPIADVTDDDQADEELFRLLRKDVPA